MVTVKQSQFGIAITWIIVNTILMLVGAGIGVMGFLVAFSPEGLCFLYKSQLHDALGEIYLPTLATKCINFGEILGWEVKGAVIAFGSVLFLLGLFAVISAVWPRTWALAFYIAIIALYIVVLASALIAYFIAVDTANEYTAKDYVQDIVKTKFSNSYTGDDGYDDFSRFSNYIHRRYNCCGIDGDFSYAKKWDHYYSLPTTVESPEAYVDDLTVLPMSCCIKGRLRDCLGDREATTTNAWVRLGCFEGKLASEAEGVAKFFAIGLAVFTIFLAFSITLAFIICTPLMAAKKQDPTDYNKFQHQHQPYLVEQASETRRPPSLSSQQPREPAFVQDSVTRWHSQFGSRFYDNQIFKSYNNNNSTNNNNNNGTNGVNPVPLPPRR